MKFLENSKLNFILVIGNVTVTYIEDKELHEGKRQTLTILFLLFFIILFN